MDKDNTPEETKEPVELHPICVDTALAANNDRLVKEIKGAFLDRWQGVSFDWACECVERMLESLTLQWQASTTPMSEDDKFVGESKTYDVTNFTLGGDSECIITLYRDRDNHDELMHMNVAIRLEKERVAELYKKMQDYLYNGGKLPKIASDNPYEYGTLEYVEHRSKIEWTNYEIDKVTCAMDYFDGKHVNEDAKFAPETSKARSELTYYMIARIGRLIALTSRALKRVIAHDNLCRAIIHQIYTGKPEIFDPEEVDSMESRPEFLEKQREAVASEFKLLLALGKEAKEDEPFMRIVPKQD